MCSISKESIFVILIAFIFFVIIRHIERHSIFFPMKTIDTTPAVIGLGFEDLSLKTADNCVLNGWFIPQHGAADTVLFCHGNGGNISHRLEKIKIFNALGMSVFIFDYRGYGRSNGSPSERGIYNDAEAAYQYLIGQKGVPAENLYIFGESLGGAVAIDLASRHAAKALITEGTFSSVKDMLRSIYHFLPVYLLESRFDSIPKIARIRIPKLIIQSVDDEIVPFALGEKIFAHAAGPKEFLKIRGGHNTAFIDSRELFVGGIESFIDKLR